MFDNQIQSPWPEWQFVKVLGSGSYGVVYEAVRIDHGVASHSAIKQISIPQHPSELRSLREEGLTFAQTRTFLEGVKDEVIGEIELMETFKGVSNIVSVEDYKVIERTEDVGWDIYIRMELLMPLSNYVSERRMTEQEVINLGIDICTALELCENRKVIHRDIKPANIFVNAFGNFKLGDFGIARKMENLSMGMSYKGTFNYMAPEIASRSPHYDSTVDLYSLGIVLYQFTNGMRLPLCNTGDQALTHTAMEVALNQRLSGEKLPAPINASPALASVILKACEYQPSHRFRSAAEMKAALFAVKQNTESLYVKEERTNRLLKIFAGGLAAVVIFSLSAAFLLGRKQSVEQAGAISYTDQAPEESMGAASVAIEEEQEESTDTESGTAEGVQEEESDTASGTADEAQKEESETPSETEDQTEKAPVGQEGVGMAANEDDSLPDAGGSEKQAEEDQDTGNEEQNTPEEAVIPDPGEVVPEEEVNPEPEEVQGLHYAVSYDEISQELRNEINQHTIAELMDRQGGGSGVEVLSYSYYGDLFMAADEGTTPHNKLFNIYTAEIRFTDITDGVQYQAIVSQKYYRRYIDIQVDPSTGDFIVDLEGSTDPMVTDFELFNADGTASVSVEYQGAHSYEELYNDLMTDEDNSQHFDVQFYPA